MKPILVVCLVMLLVIVGCGGAAPSTTNPEADAGTQAVVAQAELPCFFEPGAGEADALTLAAEPGGVLLSAVPRQSLVVEARSADWVLVVAPDSGSQGWLRSAQGSLSGNCDTLEVLEPLPPLPEQPTVPPPICTITAQVDTPVYAQPGQSEPSSTLIAGQSVEALVRTAERWYGYAFQPGGTTSSLAQLAWLPVAEGKSTAVMLSLACAALPVVTYP